METLVAKERASMPAGTQKVLNRRTLEQGNEHLIPFLRTGMRVLDVGCGSGSITKGIAESVGVPGQVIGIDMNVDLIGQARRNFGTIPNLQFEQVDLFDYHEANYFDVVTSARTMQWLSSPRQALARLISMVKPGGVVQVLDYNHEKIQWAPQIPPSMKRFYQQFLAWRADAGMSNRVADELAGMMESLGLKSINQADASESCTRVDPGFIEAAGIWGQVAALRGPQMVEAGFLTERERREAEASYEQWLKEDGQSMTLYLTAVTGVKS